MTLCNSGMLSTGCIAFHWLSTRIISPFAYFLIHGHFSKYSHRLRYPQHSYPLFRHHRHCCRSRHLCSPHSLPNSGNQLKGCAIPLQLYLVIHCPNLPRCLKSHSDHLRAIHVVLQHTITNKVAVKGTLAAALQVHDAIMVSTAVPDIRGIIGLMNAMRPPRHRGGTITGKVPLLVYICH